MNRLERYIAKTIISSTGVVLAILLGIQSFIQFAAQLQDVGKGNYQWLEALFFVPLMLPSDLYLLFPMAALMGSLIGLGRLTTSSELVVMRTSGMSLFRIAKAIIVTAIIMMFVTTMIGEFVGPKARDKALKIKAIALSKGQMLQTRHGVWLRDGHKFIHIAHINNKIRISGVTLYQFGPNNKLVSSRYAKEAVYENNQWQFLNVDESIIYDDHVQTYHYKKQSWPVKIDTHLVMLSKVDPNQQSLHKLYQYLKFRRSSGMGQGPYEFVFWKRIFQPLSTLVMILLAIPFIFGTMGRGAQSNSGFRVVIGIFIGFGFYILNQFFGPMSQVYQIPAVLAALLPSVIFALVGLVLLRFKR